MSGTEYYAEDVLRMKFITISAILFGLWGWLRRSSGRTLLPEGFHIAGSLCMKMVIVGMFKSPAMCAMPLSLEINAV